MRLIDADALKIYYEKHGDCDGSGWVYDSTIDCIDAQPTIEAEPVVHGEWRMDTEPDDGDCRCSHCHMTVYALHRKNHTMLKLLGYELNTFYRFCPHCGAHMDGGDK